MISFLNIRPYCLVKVKLPGIIQLSNKEGNMKTKKQLIVCLTVCLVLSFVAAVYAAPLDVRAIPVTVNNTNLKPMPVIEVSKYQVQKGIITEFLQVLSVTRKTLYTVPLNRRLVIEYFSCQSMGSYSTSYSCFIRTGTGPDAVDHFLPTTPYGHPQMLGDSNPAPIISNPLAYMSAGQRVQIYAEPGTEVEAGAYRQTQSPAIQLISDYPAENMYFSFSGYLIDIAP
jgi:hypothetical protein